MNVSIIHKSNVQDYVLDDLAKELPIIVSGVLELPGGKLAVLKPDQISLDFSQASVRDVGPDIRIKILARNINLRTKTENDRAKSILEKVITLVSKSGEEYSIDVRLYLMEIGAAEHLLSI
jgi:hypothetical protein